MRIAAYCRVSTDKEAQIESLENQKLFFEDFAKKQGYLLVQIYADEGISGKQVKNRTQFLRLLEDAKLGLFDMVVVKDISRFARNTVDSLQAIRELKACHVEILFLSNNQTVLGNSEFMLTIFSALAQEESANLSKRVKFGLEVSAKKGRVPNFIYGYERLDAQTLQIQPEEAQVVEEIFRLYAKEGLGTRRIAATLDERGIATRQGAGWSPKTIRRILANPIYAGVLLNHKTETTDFLTGAKRSRPQEEWFVHPREEYRIVDPDLYEKAQDVMRERQRRYQKNEEDPAGRYSGRHRFSTLIQCSRCGYSFTRRVWSSRLRTHVFWHCAGNHNRTAAFCPNTINLYEEDLLCRLKEYFLSVLGDPAAFQKEVEKEVRRRLAGEREQESAAKLKDQRHRLFAQLERQKDLYTEGILSMEELKAQRTRLTAKIQELEKRIAAQQKKQEEMETEEDVATKEPLDLERWENGDFRRLLEKITVEEDGTVRIGLREYVRQKESHSPFVGS